MNNVKELLKKAPYICNCDDPDRVSLILQTIYEKTSGNGNAFDPTEKDFKFPNNRLRFIDLTNPFWGAKDMKAAKKIMALLTICMWKGWERKGTVTKEESDAVIRELHTDAIIENAAVDTVMTFSQAMSNWWFPG